MYDFYSKYRIDFIFIFNNNFEIFYKINNERDSIELLFYL